MSKAKPVEVKARSGYRLWLSYDDGQAGEVDLSDLAGRGVFKAWADGSFFKRVHVGPYGEIAWSDEIDLCPDALYLRLTGRKPEDVFPRLKPTRVNA